MGWTALAHVAAGSSDDNTVTSAGMDTTTADLLVLVLGQENGVALAAVSDSKGNSWNQLTSYNDGAVKMAIFWSRPSSVGAAHTFTATQAGSKPGIAVSAFRGSATAPFDQVNGNAAGVGDTIQTGSVTAGVNDALLIAGASGRAVAGAIVSINSGFTIGASVAPGANNDSAGIAYLVQANAAAINPTWTFTSAGGSMVASLASFKPGGAHRMFMVF
jgi:hypothetical protein